MPSIYEIIIKLIVYNEMLSTGYDNKQNKSTGSFKLCYYESVKLKKLTIF